MIFSLRVGGGLLVAAIVAAGCSVVGESTAFVGGEASASAVTSDADELGSVLGNDRVGRALREHPSAIPYTLEDVESLYGIGRACSRADTKEIFVAEEKDTRLTGSQVRTPELTPRLVVGGCNHHPADPNAIRETFELFLAVVSSTDRPMSDPLATTGVEAMALDDTTGLYNFYVLEAPTTKGATGTVTRFVRRADNVVEKWQRVAGQPATKAVNDDRKCFNCHIHGDPIMNELTEPWTNWVSSHKQFSRPLVSTSRSLVSESRPFAGEHTRSSLANQLEQVTRAALAMWVEGIPRTPGSGLGPQILSGAQPGGVPALLKSVFCETTVNYASAFDTVPLPLFVDGASANFAALQPPLAVPGATWTLLPVRAEVDVRIERFLQKSGILRPDTVLAVRLLDDTRDVFSPKRCALQAAVTPKLGGATSVDAVVRAAVLAAVDGGAASSFTAAQLEFIRALVGPTVSSDVRDSAENAYIADLSERLQVATAKLDSPEGRQELEMTWRARQASARALFPTAANPLPITN